MVTEDDLKAIDAKYKDAIKAAEDERSTTLALAAEQGWKQKDVIAATGYSRETVRRLTKEGRGEQ